MIYILGGGGHAKVIIDILREVFPQEELEIRDDNPNNQNKEIYGVKVTGMICSLPESFQGRAIIAIGNNSIREKIAKKLPNTEWVTAVHPSATVSKTAKLGVGCMIIAGATIQSDCYCGNHVIVNTASTVDHECKIDSFAHICPGVNLAGNVSVGQGCFIGIGSSVIQGISIGENSIVGAGSCVIDDLPPNTVSVGSPAKVIKILD